MDVVIKADCEIAIYYIDKLLSTKYLSHFANSIIKIIKIAWKKHHHININNLIQLRLFDDRNANGVKTCNCEISVTLEKVEEITIWHFFLFTNTNC